MTITLPSEIYRVAGKKGPRYYRRSGMLQGHRLFPLDTATAEIAFAAGATVYVKTKGETWLKSEVGRCGTEA